jgi:hypothetical protein
MAGRVHATVSVVRERAGLEGNVLEVEVLPGTLLDD